MDVLIEGVPPWDGRYQLDLIEQQFTTREWGHIKRLTGYLPVGYEEGLDKADPELICVFAVLALRRAGKIETPDVAGVYERLIDAPAFAAVTLDTTTGQPREEGDADPTASSSGNGGSSGADSRASSETSAALPSSSGIHGWDSSG